MYRFRHIASYLSKVADFILLHLHLAPPLGVTPVEFRRDLWHQKTTVPGLSCGFICVILCLAVFIRTPTCDRHRHRQTQGHSIYRASITLRGKNEKKIIVGLMIIIIVITTTSLSVIFQSAIFQARNSTTALSVIFQSVKFQSFRFPRTSFSGREFSALVLVASLPVCCATTLASRYRFLNH